MPLSDEDKLRIQAARSEACDHDGGGALTFCATFDACLRD
jgi:hypothetical protein